MNTGPSSWLPWRASFAGRPVVRQALSLGTARVLAAFLAAAWLLVAARELPLTAFADLSLLLALSLMLATVADFGLPLLLVAAVAEQKGTARAGVQAVVKKRLLLGLAATTILGALWLPLATESSLMAVGLFGLSILATIVYSTVFAALRGMGRVAPEAVNEVVSRVVVLSIGAALLLRGGGLVSAVIPYAAADLASAGASVIIARKHLPESSGSPPELSIRRALPIASANILANVYYRMDVWLLALLSDPRSLALYAASYRLYEGLGLPSGAIGAVAVASVVQRPESERYARVGRVATFAGLVVAAPALGMGLFATTTMTTVFGDAFGVAGGLLRVLLLAAVPTAVIGSIGAISLVMEPKRVKRLLAAVLILGTGLDLLTIGRWGALAAAWVTVVCQTILAVGLWFAVSRRRPWGKMA